MTATMNPTDTPVDRPLPYGPPLTLAQAKAVMEKAETLATDKGWPVAIVIADATGHVVLALRRDQTQHSSLDIATGKALTAVNYRRPTRFFQEGISQGGEGLRFLAVKGITPLEGGFPLVINACVVGGIGVSGVLSSQDAEVALAGMAALNPQQP